MEKRTFNLPFKFTHFPFLIYCLVIVKLHFHYVIAF